MKKTERASHDGRDRIRDVRRHREDAMRAARVGAVIGFVGALIAAPSVSAGPAVESIITIEVLFDGPETFTTEGGVVCPSGTSETTLFATLGGSKNLGRSTFHLVKTLTCDGGGGTFKLLVNVVQNPEGTGTTGGFAINKGTGTMAGIRGGGEVVGTYYPDRSGITGVYTGHITIAP
jgi:hypothetical protein